jgi:ABC-type transport system substrate-binding protein
VATGPYYVRRYEPDRQIELARNPGWVRAGPDADAAHVDRIVVQIGVSPAESLRRLAAGEADYTQSRLGRDALPRGVRVQRQVEAATYYYFMNTTVPPFDDVRVRRAVNLAIDRARIARLFEGEAVATQQVLPPTVPGYRRIAPFGEPDLARARALVRRAGETGARVTVWGYNTEPSPAVTAYLAGVLRTIGLRPTTRFLDKSTALRTVATRATKAQIGYARWQSDFPDGADYFSLLLHGRSVRATDGLNYSYLNHPGLNRLIEAAEREFDPARRAEAWSQVDRAVADIAPWAPFANSVRTDLTSGRVRGYLAHPVYGFVWLRAGVA